jgi:hypothetical protein
VGGQPAGQHGRIHAAVQEPAAGRDERQAGRPVAGAAEQELAEGGGEVTRELGIRDAGLLEVHHVEGVADAAAHGGDRRGRAAGAVGHAQPDHPADPVRPQQRGVPGHRRAPVVPGQHRLPFAEYVHQPDDVAGQVQDGVRIRGRRAAGPAVPALIRRDRVESGGGQRGQLVTPRVPRLREAVQQQHERPAARLGDMHPQAADVEVAMSDSGGSAGRLRHDGRIASGGPART